LFAFDCLLLGYVGGHPPEGILVTLGQIGTAYYFIHFLILIPLIGIFEKPMPLPDSIASAVVSDKPVLE